MLRVVSSLLALIVVLWCGETSAADRTSSLSWLRLEGAESCVSTPELARAVETRLGRRVFVSPSQADISIEGHARRVGKDFRIDVSVRDAAGSLVGTRELTGSSCEALLEPLVLVVAVMIDPDAATRSPSTTPAPADEKPEPEAPAAPPRIEVRREVIREVVAVREEPALSAQVGVSGVAGVGFLPSPSPGVSIGLLLRPRRFWGVVASGTYWFDQERSVALGARARFGLVSGAIGLCPLALDGRQGVALLVGCFGANGGALRGTGLGFDAEASKTRLLLHAMAEVRGSLRIAGSLYGHAGLTGLVSVLETQAFVYVLASERHVAYETSRFGAALDLGLRVALP